MRKIPKKWSEPALIFLAGALLTLKSQGKPGLFDISDSWQMIIVMVVCVIVFLIRHIQEKRRDKEL